jgi:hypothetical protein
MLGHAVNRTRGLNGLLVAYLVRAGALLHGMRPARGPISRLLLLPFIAIPVLIAALILWTALFGLLNVNAIAPSMIPFPGLIFVAAASPKGTFLFSYHTHCLGQIEMSGFWLNTNIG